MCKPRLWGQPLDRTKPFYVTKNISLCIYDLILYLVQGCVSRTSSTSSEEEGEIIEEGDSDDDFVHLQEGSERERIFQDQVITQFPVLYILLVDQ